MSTIGSTPMFIGGSTIWSTIGIMGRSFYIITGLIGFLSGVALYLVWRPGWVVVFVFTVGFCCLFFASALCFGGRSSTSLRALSVFALAKRQRRRGLLSALSLFFVFLSLGLMRGGLAEHHVTPDQVDYYNGQKVELAGLITETDIRGDKAKYQIEIDGMMFPEGGIDQSRLQINQFDQSRLQGTVLITLDKYPQYHYGDRVKLYGELKEPGEFDGFDYGNYLSRYDVYSVMYYPKIAVLETGQGNWFWTVMSWAQNRFLAQINKLLPEPQASFEAGLLVGARKGIPDDLVTKFNITGLTHIIAISGYNITIIIVCVMWLLSGLPRKTGFYMAIGAIILFTLFVGASPSVTRASIMGILGLLALNYGRQSNIHLTILWTAFFMVLWNPKILWWDAGFQLSFAAVLGLIYVAPLFKKYAEKLPQAFGVREAILMTLSAQVMALPIIVYNFGRLSLIAPVANLFVIFAIPPAMLFGFIAVVLSFFSHIIGLIPAYIAWGILSYIIGVIEMMAGVPYASVNIGGMRIWMMIFYYAALIGFLVWRSHRRVAINRDSTSDGNSVIPS
jgi:competence protein ComEC